MMKRSLIKKAVFAAVGAFCSITALANVAKVGETEYGTLQEALTAAATTADVEVTLINDTTENITVPAGFNGTIDLGGKTLSGCLKADSKAMPNMVVMNGNLKNTSSYVVHFYSGALKLNNVNLTVHQNHGLRLQGPVQCVIDGGIYKFSNETEEQAPTGGYHLIYLKEDAKATLTIKNGSFSDVKNDPKNITTAVTLMASGNTIIVEGGTFAGTFHVNSGSSAIITGGLFAGNVRSHCATGYTIVGPVEGYYTVQKANYALTVNAENAEVSELNATYQYEDEVSFTVTPATGYKVTSVKLGTDELTADANGNYTFSMPAKAATITVTVEAESTFDVTIGGDTFANADALKGEAKAGTEMTVPETSTWTADGNVLKKDGEAYVEFAGYYTVVVNGTTVTLKLNKPVVGESQDGADDAFTVTAEEVTIKITNYNSALKYGVRSAADINGLSAAEITVLSVANGNITEDGVITLEKSGDSAFYEVVVSDVDFPVAE